MREVSSQAYSKWKLYPKTLHPMFIKIHPPLGMWGLATILTLFKKDAPRSKFNIEQWARQGLGLPPHMGNSMSTLGPLTGSCQWERESIHLDRSLFLVCSEVNG